jgi:hypothetical protein
VHLLDMRPRLKICIVIYLKEIDDMRIMTAAMIIISKGAPQHRRGSMSQLPNAHTRPVLWSIVDGSLHAPVSLVSRALP